MNSRNEIQGTQNQLILTNISQLNYYPPLEFEEQIPHELIKQQPLEFYEGNPMIQQMESDVNQESGQLPEMESLNTFEGYIEEEPSFYFNFIEEQPKKKVKPISKRSRKVRKSDTETDFHSVRRCNKILNSNEFTKLQQCQMLKNIITQMESTLQKKRAEILQEYINKCRKQS